MFQFQKKIPASLSAEFAETMFLLTGNLGIIDKAIGDPVSHAVAQPKLKIMDKVSYL